MGDENEFLEDGRAVLVCILQRINLYCTWVEVCLERGMEGGTEGRGGMEVIYIVGILRRGVEFGLYVRVNLLPSFRYTVHKKEILVLDVLGRMHGWIDKLFSVGKQEERG